MYAKYEEGRWTNPRNLGESVNTKNYDWFPRVKADEKYLLFARTVSGKIDLYWVYAKIIDDLKPDDLK